MANHFEDNDIVQFTTVCRLNQQNGLMVWHYRVTEVAGLTTHQQGVEYLSLRHEGAIKALMSNAATYRGAILQKIRPLPIDTRVTTAAHAGTGTVVSDPMSSQTCGEFALRTDLAGRQNRGRKYVPFPATDDNDEGGHPVESYRNRLGVLANLIINTTTLVQGGGSVTFVPVIFQRGTGIHQFMSSAAIRIEWATQRRRSQLNRGDEQILL